MGALVPMSTLIDNNIKKHFRAKYDFVCIPLRNFMGVPMLPTPVYLHVVHVRVFLSFIIISAVA